MHSLDRNIHPKEFVNGKISEDIGKFTTISTWKCIPTPFDTPRSSLNGNSSNLVSITKNTVIIDSGNSPSPQLQQIAQVYYQNFILTPPFTND